MILPTPSTNLQDVEEAQEGHRAIFGKKPVNRPNDQPIPFYEAIITRRTPGTAGVVQ